MKVIIILMSIIFLLVGLPWLHGFIVFQSITDLALESELQSFYYLFTIPAWAVSIMVFVVETYRRYFIFSEFNRISNVLVLGLFGLMAPVTGLALSPVGAEIELIAYAVIAMIGLVVGLLGAVLFNSIVARIVRFDQR